MRKISMFVCAILLIEFELRITDTQVHAFNVQVKFGVFEAKNEYFAVEFSPIAAGQVLQLEANFYEELERIFACYGRKPTSLK